MRNEREMLVFAYDPLSKYIKYPLSKPWNRDLVLLVLDLLFLGAQSWKYWGFYWDIHAQLNKMPKLSMMVS
jgi:hypothetical protein